MEAYPEQPASAMLMRNEQIDLDMHRERIDLATSLFALMDVLACDSTGAVARCAVKRAIKALLDRISKVVDALADRTPIQRDTEAGSTTGEP